MPAGSDYPYRSLNGDPTHVSGTEKDAVNQLRAYSRRNLFSVSNSIFRKAAISRCQPNLCGGSRYGRAARIEYPNMQILTVGAIINVSPLTRLKNVVA